MLYGQMIAKHIRKMALFSLTSLSLENFCCLLLYEQIDNFVKRIVNKYIKFKFNLWLTMRRG